MSLKSLTAPDREVVRRAMAATFRYFDADFHTRLGVWEHEMHALLSAWPEIEDSDDDGPASLAINNSLNDLLNGVGISEEEAREFIGVDRAEMRRIYKKWARARGWSSTGLR